MAVDNYNSNINVNVNTGQSLAELRRLQAALSEFNQAVVRGNRNAAISQEAINSRLIQQVNAIQGLSAAQRRISGTTDAFTTALERNKLTLREYARYSAAGFLEGGLGRALSERSKLIKSAFAKERTVLTRAYEDRVKLLQSQWIRLTKPGVAGGTEGLRITPTTLKSMDEFATRTQLAAQRMQLLNATMRQGATGLINWGKNTQWAGRQLMVGLTMPLIMLGATAAKTFRELEMQTIRFRRVYGDLFTDEAQTDAAVENIMRLAKEFTKFGITVVDTMEMAANAAAMGNVGAALEAQVTEATRLAVLGGVEQEQALETTISLTNAFGVASEDLAQKIDFLNAVENQTVVSIEDLTIAIPKAGPVVQQLGGNVEDLAFFLTAMREGGINASEGANALKSGLASLINPTDKASKMFAGLGINIKGIIEANKGDIKATVVGFAQALDTLDPLNRARAIEQLFGKFQFARLSTLFKNVVKDGSQASRVLDLMSASTEELAILSERELGKVEEAVGVKFQKTLEEVKLQLLPLGKLFLESLMPVLKFVGKIIENFNELGDGTKRFILVFATAFPAALMALGLFGNLVGNTVKALWGFNMIMAKVRGTSNVLGASFNYMTMAEIENTSMTAAMSTGHTKLIEVFNVEAAAARQLATAYNQASAAAARLAAANPGFFVGGKAGAAGAASKLPKKFNRGTKNVKYYAKGTDTVPAMLTPGEAVIPAESAQDPANKPLIQAMIAGKKAQSFGVGDSEVKSQSAGLSAAAKKRNAAARSYMILSPEQEAAKEKKSQSAKRGWETRKLNALKKETVLIEQSAEDKKKVQQEEKRAKAGRIAGRVSGAGMLGGMVAYGMGNTGAGNALMAGGILANFAPMLMNPYVAAGVAVVALMGSFFALNKVLEARAKKEEQFVRSVTANTDQLRRVSEVTKTVGASQEMAKRRGMGTLQGYNETQRVGREFGGQFLDSDIGKEIYKGFAKNKDIYGTKKAAKQFALQLSAYISDGIMTAEQANSIAEQIAVNLGDVTIRTKIQGELMMLVGPKGQDILKDPLTTRLNMIRASGREERRLAKDEGFKSLSERANQEDTFYQTETTVRLRMGGAQMAAYAASTAEFAQAQLDSFTIFYEKQIKAKNDQLAITKDKEKQVELQKEINTLIEEQRVGERTLQKEVSNTIDATMKNFEKKIQEGGFGNAIFDYLFSAKATTEDAYFDALKGKIKDIYKGTEFETASDRVLKSLSKLSDSFVFTGEGFDTKDKAQQFEVNMQVLLANKIANPDQIETFMSLFKGDLQEGRAALNISLKTQGAAKTFELQSLLAGMGPGKKAKALAREYFLKISALPSPQFDKQAKAMAVLSELDGKEINMKFILSEESSFNFTKYANDLAQIENMPDVTEKTVRQTLQTIGMDSEGIKGLMKDWETYYSKLPETVRKEAVQKYLTFYEFQSEFKDDIAKREWIERYARKKATEALNKTGSTTTYDTVYRFQIQNLTGMSDKELSGLRSNEITKEFFGPITDINPIVPGVDNETGKGRAGKDTALDDLLKKLKMVRDAAINAEGGIKELLRITAGKGINKFTGVMQQLQTGVTAQDKKGKTIGKGIKANRGFLDFVQGLDKKTFAEFVRVTKKGKVILTEAGKAANEAFAEAPIGEFQEQQKRTAEGAIAQRQAFLKLRAAGVGYSQALEMIKDESLAIAIVSKDIDPNELRKMADEAEAAAHEVRILNQALRDTAEATRDQAAELRTSLEALRGANTGALQKEMLKQVDAQIKIQKAALANADSDKQREAILKNITGLEENRTVIAEKFEKLTKEQLALIASDPGLAQGIADLLKGAVPSEEMANKIKDIFDALEGTTINAQLQLEVDIEKDAVSAIKKQIDEIGANMNKYFQLRRSLIEREFRAEKRAAEAAVRTAEERVRVEQEAVQVIQDRIDAIQLEIDKAKLAIDLEFDVPLKTAQDAAEKLSRSIETDLSREIERLQELSDDLSRSVELEFTRPIEDLQSQINTLSRSIETNFERPIAALQEESSDLSNELELMDKVVESINEKYDKQEEALQSISDINQDIASQERSRISLADALSQGDISAAAQLAQEMRNEAAQKAASSESDKLRVARENELSRVLARNGMTRKQIEDRQFAIGQQIFNLEEQREQVDIRVLALQDRIYNIEQAREVKNREINALADQIYNLGEQREAQQLILRGIEDSIYNLEKARKVLLDATEIKERQILEIRYNELIPAQAKLDLQQKELDKQRLILEGIQLQEKEALDSLQAQEDAWSDVELAILEAELAMFDFNAALQEAIRLAQQLAALMASMGQGSFGTASYKTGTQYGDIVGQESAIERVQEAIGYDPEEGYDGQFTEVENKGALKGVVESQTNFTDDMILDYFTTNNEGCPPGFVKDEKTGECVPDYLASTREYFTDVIQNIAEGVATNSEVLDYANVVGRLTGQRVALAGGGSVKDKVKYMMGGGNIMPKYMNNGGMFKAINTDTVPAMLSPGEFVMSKYAVKNFGVDNMKAINDGTYAGESVYNYSISVNVKSGANPDEIARSVMTQIKQIDSQRIRGQRV